MATFKTLRSILSRERLFAAPAAIFFLFVSERLNLLAVRRWSSEQFLGFIIICSLLYAGTLQSAAQSFTWPVDNPTIGEVYGCRGCLTFSAESDRYQSGINMHTGADVDVSGAAAYSVPVYAAADGIVARVVMCGTTTCPNSHGLGNVVIVQHANGKYTLYGHLDSIDPSITPGQAVKQRGTPGATQLGIMGNSGTVPRDSFGIHVHFEIKDFPALGNISDSGTYWGYTPGHPDLESYNDPRSFILGITVETATPFVLRNPPPGDLSIRSSPGLTYLGSTPTAIIGSLGQSQEIVARKHANVEGVDWYFIDLPSRNSPLTGSTFPNNDAHGGWISGAVAVVDSSATQLRIADTSPHNVRSSADTGTSVIAKVYPEQRFVAAGSSTAGPGCTGPWYPIYLSGTSAGDVSSPPDWNLPSTVGWICSDGLEVILPGQNYVVSVSASPSVGGAVGGGGTFVGGTSQIVSATANLGYAFTNWTESGAIVSTSATYSFVVNRNRTLIGNFSIIPAGCISINNIVDLQNISQNLAGNYCLTNDIDASATATWNSGAGFIPIGDYGNPFVGILDGQGHTVDGLMISSSTTRVGLFGYIVGGIVRNIGLTNAVVTGTFSNGFLPYNPTVNQTYENGGQFIGGLAGQNNAMITNAYVTGFVAASSWGFVGGLVGWNAGPVSNSFTTGSVNSSSTSNVFGEVGGLVADNESVITHSYSTATVSGTGYMGGLAGWSQTHIQQSYATGQVTVYAIGEGGGLVGGSNGAIDDSYATGSVTAVSSTTNAGGSLGGLVGANSGALISRSYATGTVSDLTGSFVMGGLFALGAGSASSSYWDVQSTGQSTSIGGTGVTTAQLKSGLPSGFDSSIWAISANVNSGYPCLQWQAGCSVQQQVLQVSPTTDITASGNQGGPFSPASFPYQLSASSGSIGYSISGVPNWLDASATSGSLTTSATTVTFTVNATANSLPAGTYGPVTIAFTNTTNGQGNATLTATLTVSPSSYTLAVRETGSGTVTSAPSGISCPAACSANYNAGTAVTLTAVPAGGWSFAGWSGACSGTGTCIVTMSSTQSASATFTLGGVGASPIRTFVSVIGSDANPCTFALPCKSVQHAHDVVAAGGEVRLLDPGSYGLLTITKSISILGDGHGGIAAQSGATAITINAGASDRVNLRGVVIEGFGTGQSGISLTSGGSLNIQDSVIRNFIGLGIKFNPASASQLNISQTVISDAQEGGVYIIGLPSEPVSAVLKHVRLIGNTDGLFVSGGISYRNINVTIADSVVTGNPSSLSLGGGGIIATGSTIDIMVRNCIVGNYTKGIVANGPNTIRVTKSTVTGNVNGFSNAVDGVLISYGDNKLGGNTNNGSPTSIVGLH